MGDVEELTNGAVEKITKDLKSHKHDGPIENGVLVGEERRLLKEYASNTLEEAQDVNYVANGVVVSGDHYGSQKEPLSQVVRWDRFLPFQSLKVLLVENDDSTRHVVSALLRNCGYEVSNATNGAQAWKILQELTVHIDLVLTEAAMPFLSGIGLLCKIMSHKTRKNIPVIMMSSVDSMNLVFQCLSKGAADFLFKPVRKNELKNLWQHVWRRCHSSSGSASESVVLKSKSVGESDNNTSSNDENDNASVGLNLRDGSDNGSGTQSSWTKRAVEVESPQPMSPWKLPAEAHDSTCAQVTYSKPEISDSEMVVAKSKRNILETKEFLDPAVMGRDLEMRISTKSELQHKSCPREVPPVKLPDLKHNSKLPTEGFRIDNDTSKCVGLCDDTDNHFKEVRSQLDDKIGIGASSDTVIHLGVGPSETLTGPSIISSVKDKRDFDAKELPALDQNFKRLKSNEDGANPQKDDRNVLRHSDQSAFSRYITTNSTTQGANGCGGSCSTPINDNNSSEAIKLESAYNLASNYEAIPINQGSNGSSNNNDMESTTKKDLSKLTSAKDKLSPMSEAACAKHKSSAFHQLQHWRSSPSQKLAPEKANDIASAAAAEQARANHHQVQVQHHHYHYHHHHHRHHVHSLPQPLSPLLDRENLNKNSMLPATPQCGSSNAIGGPMENNANYSVNGSASGSNHGSNGQNGSSTAANNGAANVESDNGTAGKSGGDDGSGSGPGSGVEQNRSAQREAALIKFRLKRKERCYEKKVRYQTRKKLAEQRPRVRGQFVRQTTQGPKNQDADS